MLKNTKMKSDCFSYPHVLHCSDWSVTSHSASEVCHLMFSKNSPRWKGERAHVPYRQGHWGTAQDSEHCQSETEEQKVLAKSESV